MFGLTFISIRIRKRSVAPEKTKCGRGWSWASIWLNVTEPSKDSHIQVRRWDLLSVCCVQKTNMKTCCLCCAAVAFYRVSFWLCNSCCHTELVHTLGYIQSFSFPHIHYSALVFCWQWIFLHPPICSSVCLCVCLLRRDGAFTVWYFPWKPQRSVSVPVIFIMCCCRVL